MNINVPNHRTTGQPGNHFSPRPFPRHPWLWVVPLLLLGAAGLTHLVKACTQPPANPPSIIVMPLTNGCVKIVICDYTTFGTPTNPPMFCACALNVVGPIAAIKSVQLQLTNGLPLPGFNFNPNANAGAYFNATTGGNWQGFLSSVTQNIPPRIPIKIVITVQLAVGSSPHDLANALASVGPIIATGGAQPNGTPIPDNHLAVLPAGPVVVMPASELVPVITSVTPNSGGEGTLIGIVGHNFGNNPDNLCVIIMNGGLSIPLEVVTLSPTLITARVGVVRPDAVPGPIGIAVGRGAKGFFKPAFADVDVAQPAWVWVRDPNGPDAMSPAHFNPIPSPPPNPGTQTRWFFSGPPTNGNICLYLDGPWPNPAKVRIQARAHDHERGIGRDLEAYCIEFPASGSTLDCAARICDSIRCAFMQQGMVSVNCRIDPIPGSSIVKLTLSMPDGRIGWGNLNVCVEPGLPAADPVITSITPQQGPAGTVVTIRGTNFPTDPNDICAVVMMPDNRSVPMEVIAVTPGRVTAILGVPPPDAQPGPIMIGRGNGHTGKFRPAFFDIFVEEDVWTWEKKGGAGNSPQLFQPIPVQPPPTQQWFFSGPPTTDGRLSVLLDQPWPVGGAKVRIEARAHDHQRGIGRDLRAVHIEIRPEAGSVPTALSCGERICDVVVCAFMQQAGLAVNATASTDPLSGGTRLTLSLPDGAINWGNFNICVEPLPTPVNPVITTITPLAGRAGDIITIRGTGFGNNPDNLCMVVMNGGVSIPMQAIKATDTEVRAVLGQVPPDAVPGPIMIGLGEGQVGRFRPAFFDIFVADDVWTWNRTGGATMTTQNFTPIPEPFAPASDTAPRWFFSGPPTNGVICLFIDGRWPQPAILRVQARAHDHIRGIGRDLSAYEIHLEGGGSLLDCAHRICDTIRCAFMQQGNLAVECNVQQVGTNTVKLTLSLPDGSIGWGNFNVCVEQGPTQPSPVITSVTPAQGGEGALLTIRGTGFGNNPDNLCVVMKPAGGNEAVPLEVLSVSNDVIRAVLGPVSPTAGSNGPVMVGLGRGGRDFFTPALTNIVVRKPVWVWDRNNGNGGMGGVFRPIPNQPNPTNTWFWSGPPTNGMLMLTLSGNWPANAFLRIEARVHDHIRKIGHDLRAICIQFPAGGTLQQCAAQICDSIRCAFLQQGIAVNCQITQNANGQVKLTLTIPNGFIGWGNFNVCVTTATPDPVIFGVTPPLGGEGTVVRIRGTNFPTDPNDVCMVAMGPAGSLTANQSIPFEVISSVSTQIVGVLGPVPQNAQPGPIMIGVGDGAMGRFRPAFFDIFVEQDVWVWEKTGPAVMTPGTVTFRPIPQMLMPGCPRWYFSGPPTNGVLCLTLSNNCPWPQPAMIRIEARAHDHVKKVGRDLRAVKIRFEGGSTTLDCAKRICDVVRCAFLQQAGLEVNCTVAVLANGDVKLTLSLPEGQIGWGNFNVCVDPITKPVPVITSITPAIGGEGTLVTVRGTNFPTDPNDICMVTMGQPGTPGAALSTPFEVISATTTQIVGRLGAVDPQASPGPIMIGVGDGQQGYFRPAFFDIFAELPTWTWVRNGPAANSAGNFTPLPGTTQGQWFFSGPPNANGELCVTLFGSWPQPAKIQIQARAHDHQLKIGRDLQSFCIVLPGGGSTLDCAKRICDVIRCAFFQQAGIVVNCTVSEDTTGLGGVKLTLSLPEGHIDWGNFNICVTAPPTVPTPIVVTGVFPQTGREGDQITITGIGFGKNPDNVCAVIMDGPRSIPLRVIAATDEQMTVEIGAVPPDAGPGQIMLARGQGNTGRFRPAFFDIFVEDDVWTWNRAGGPTTIAPVTFLPVPRPPLPHQRWYFGERPSNGVVCLYLTGKWPDPAQVRIEARVHDHNTGVGHDLRAVNVQWGSFSMNWTGAVHVVPMSLGGCAERICDTIACAFWQQAGIRVNCEVIRVDDDTVKLVLSIPGGSVGWGNFNVCVGPVNGDPGPVIEVVRNPVLPNQIPTIDICWPRARAGYCLEERGNLHPDFIWVPAPDATDADATRLKLRVPMDERMKAFRLFKMPPLLVP